MRKKIEINLAHSIIGLHVSKKDMQGIINTINHFSLEALTDEIWYDIVGNLDCNKIVEEIKNYPTLQKDLMLALEQHGDLKNLVFFGRALNLIEKEVILQTVKLTLNEEEEAAQSLLFAAKNLYDLMTADARAWAQEAKEIAFAMGDPENFLEACDFLQEEPAEEHLLDLISREIDTLTEQQKNKDPGKIVLPECKKCLKILNRLPKEKGEKLRKIIFE